MKKFLSIYSFVICAIAVEAVTIDEWTKSYNVVLNKYVHSSSKEGIKTTLVDYNSIAHLSEWNTLVNQLETIPSPSMLSKQEQLSFWINIYNFLTINKVVEKPTIKKLTDLNGFFRNVWKQDAGVVGGRSVTLDEIEHEIIRKQFNEPRIHMAVVCAAISCPDLRPEAYRASRLYDQLTDQLNIFSRNSLKGLSLDHQRREIRISKIFSWFKGDFKPSVPEWLVKQGVISSKVAETYDITYFDYNWNLNSYTKE